MADKIVQVRRGTAADLTAANPKPAQGETIFEIDTGRSKTGDGTKSWNALGYNDELNLANVDLSEAATEADAKKGFNVAQAKALNTTLGTKANSEDVIAKTAISSESATDGKFSTTAVEGDASKLVNMSQLRTLQAGISSATHEVSGEVANADGSAKDAAEGDGTTGTSLTAAKAIVTRVKALEDDDVIDGGVITGSGD